MTTDTKRQLMVEGARLWDEERPAMKARQWTEGEWWKDFEKLSASQIAGLRAGAAGARTSGEFLEKVSLFVTAMAKRRNGKSPWDRNREGTTLRERLALGLKDGLRNTLDAKGPRNDEFQSVCRRLGPERAAAANEVRQLRILEEYLDALVIRYRVRKLKKRGGAE